MEQDNELQTQQETETLQEIYQPKPEIVCDTNDKDCLNRLIEIGDCV